MRFSAQHDVALSREQAFRTFLDIGYLERQLLRRGVEIVRQSEPDAPMEGTAWVGRFELRGQHRVVNGRIGSWEPDRRADLVAESGGFSGTVRVDMAALSRGVTRLRVALDLKARGFRDRMLLNALKLSKPKISRAFEKAVEDLARDAERRAVRA